MIHVPYVELYPVETSCGIHHFHTKYIYVPRTTKV